MQLDFILATLFAATVMAHGVIVNPPSRKLGPGMTKLCGQTAFDIARGDVTASLETVAPNITAGCKSIHTFQTSHWFAYESPLFFRPIEFMPWTSVPRQHASLRLPTRPSSPDGY